VKILDIPDGLFPERLHRLFARPGDVGCHDKIGPIQDRKKGVIFRRRLHRQNVEARARDQALVDRLHKRQIFGLSTWAGDV